MKYIDAEKMKAEIERRIDKCAKQREDMQNAQCNALAEDAAARMGELQCLLESIDSLQQEQPEVDLEKEIVEWIPEHIRGGEDEWKECREAITKWGEIVARHFFELGLKAGKEKL